MNSKAIIPVRLAKVGGENPMSRSHARHVMAGMELFSCIELDFDDVPMIGQGFADEIFRVFANAHPKIDISAINCTVAVLNMIAHVRGV